MKKIETIEDYKIVKAFISQLERKGLITMLEKLRSLERLDKEYASILNSASKN